MDREGFHSAELSIHRDPTTGVYELEGWGGRHHVREWTWGERRRLLDEHRGAGGFDRAGFVAGLLGLLVTPPPPEPLWPLYAHVVLALLGVPPGARVLPLTEAEVLLGRHVGWGPRELDAQPAPAIDRIVGQLLSSSAARTTEPDPGWNRIVFEETDHG